MTTKKESATFKRFVQVGRIVLTSEKKLAVIVEIIDHNRALIHGPATGVPRQVVSYRNVILTNLVIAKLPRGARSTAVTKAWEKSQVDTKWAESAWAKKLALKQKRKAMTDFERFSVMLLKKQRRRALGKETAKAKKSA